MAIPSYEQMLRPLLALANQGDLTRQAGTTAMEQQFELTPEERQARIPSGQATYVRNRVGWAMTFLTKARLIEKVATRTYRITESGRTFLDRYPQEIKERDLRTIPGYNDAWQSSRSETGSATIEPPTGSTPIEALDAAVETLNSELKDRLLKSVLDQSPAFFEELVLDVLLAIGYGGSRKDAAEHLGRSNDEGIDGCIRQDALGLDQIFVQAKRYSPDHLIDRQTIQAFIGALTGQGVTKGIFITTSGFNNNAREFVQRGSHTKVVLIDGNQLLNFMLQHHIGVRVQRKVEVLELDQNYFTDED